eukprot:COSAG01_NODE_1292_length_10879_cov_20.162338_7_plen_107_part_00
MDAFDGARPPQQQTTAPPNPFSADLVRSLLQRSFVNPGTQVDESAVEAMREMMKMLVEDAVHRCADKLQREEEGEPRQEIDTAAEAPVITPSVLEGQLPQLLLDYS